MNSNPSLGKSIRLARGVVLGTAAYSLILHPPLGGQLVPIQVAEAAGASADSATKASHPGATAATGQTAPQIKMVTKYTCPMHPQIIEDHPGTCPICGMTLVPKKFPEQVGGHTQADAVAQASHDDHTAHDHRKDQGDNEKAAKPAASASAHDHAVKMVTKYTCPMHPQIIEDHPGTCPICGMTLVKKKFPAGTATTAGQSAASKASESTAKETEGSRATQQPTQAAAPMPPVSVAPLTLKYMNVVTAAVKRDTLSRQLNTVGFVNYDENRLAHVHPRAEGWVEKLHVRSLGDPVKAGEVLLDVYSPDIVAAEKDYLVALRNGMHALQESARERLNLLNVPDSVIDKIRKSGKVQRTVPILAPQSGYVAQINLREGMYVKPSLDLYTIADRKRVWVLVDVLERDMDEVKVGDAAKMTVDGLPGKIWHGKVDFVYPELDARSRTLKVRVTFNNPDGVLKPNQFAEVTIDGKPRRDVLTVPTTAIIPSARGARVVQVLGNGIFQPVPVRTGISTQGRTEILGGLKAGDKVVASGQFLIDSESNIQAAFQRMAGQAQ